MLLEWLTRHVDTSVNEATGKRQHRSSNERENLAKNQKLLHTNYVKCKRKRVRQSFLDGEFTNEKIRWYKDLISRIPDESTEAFIGIIC